MLVLQRHVSERILIGENISVMVVEIRGDKVRLGIDAPRGVAVHRQEVADAIRRNDVARRMAAGEPLHAIEADLDYTENEAG